MNHKPSCLKLAGLLAVFGSFVFAEPFTCTEDIMAFDPTDTSKALGHFKTGTQLEVGKPAAIPGMVNVTYLGPDGKFVAALCRAEDVGKAPKTGKPAEAANVPPPKSGFSKSSIYKQIQHDLVSANGASADSNKLAESKYVLLYFSAHWCPPCRAFTPELVSFYNQNRNKDLEIVFVSSDKSPGDMTKYMKEMGMSWPGAKFGGNAQSYLKSQFGGRGIPCLVLLDETGQVLSHSYVDGNYVGPHKVLNDVKQKL